MDPTLFFLRGFRDGSSFWSTTVTALSLDIRWQRLSWLGECDNRAGYLLESTRILRWIFIVGSSLVVINQIHHDNSTPKTTCR